MVKGGSGREATKSWARAGAAARMSATTVRHQASRRMGEARSYRAGRDGARHELTGGGACAIRASVVGSRHEHHVDAGRVHHQESPGRLPGGRASRRPPGHPRLPRRDAGRLHRAGGPHPPAGGAGGGRSAAGHGGGHRPPDRRGVGRTLQRHRGPCARLRRHQLRPDGPSLRAGAGRGSRRGRAGAGRRPGRGPRLPARLRGGDHAGRSDQPPALRARMARHLYARDPGRGGGGGAAARARRGPDASRPRGGRVAGLRPQGELRHHDQAVPRRARGAERGALRAHGARGLDRVGARDRGTAGVLQRAGRGKAGPRAARHPGRAVEDPDHRRRGEALPLLRLHALHHRRRARAAPGPGHPRGRRGGAHGGSAG